jgi:hypothetical protein
VDQDEEPPQQPETHPHRRLPPVNRPKQDDQQADNQNVQKDILHEAGSSPGAEKSGETAAENDAA